MSVLKAIKTGYEKLQQEVKHWENEIQFHATPDNIKAQRRAVEQLAIFEKQNATRLKAIKEYPFLAK